MKRFLTKGSPYIAVTLICLAAIGYYLGTGIQLKLSLTDLLPENHPAVKKVEKLTEVVGGVGYFTVLLTAEDGASHVHFAPTLTNELKQSPLVRSVFYHREQRFFVDRLLYYLTLQQLTDLEKNIGTEITRVKRSAFDIGLWDEEGKEKEETKPVFDDELKKMAKKSADISPYLISKDKKHLLVMVKPSFDSMDLEKTETLINQTEEYLKKNIPSGVSYVFAERYYNKVVETKMIQTDIFVLGTLSILLIATLIFLYLRSFRSLLLIFIPVLMGMGLTVGITRLAIGHINIVTGFLMGIVSGLGVDYGIHLLLRLRLEMKEPSSSDPDPVWRTIASSGHSVFVGATAAAVSFFLLCFSTFRAFSEFGFICGVGITAVLFCLLTSFSAVAKFLKLDIPSATAAKARFHMPLPTLSLPKGLLTGSAITGALILIGFTVGFEYDFEKMLQHSKEMEKRADLVDEIYERFAAPSAFSSQTKEEAIAVEKLVKDKYIPKVVSEIVSGASIVPDDQAEKQIILLKIKERIKTLKDKWIERGLDIPAKVVRDWVEAKPFTWADLPAHIQDALRGTQQKGYLLYVYPAINLGNAEGVRTFAGMIRDVESQFPQLLTGSDAVVFADILDLINKDGAIILIAIFLSVGVFIFVNVRKVGETMMSYFPLLISLPVGMGLMVLFQQKFNIFNIAIIPTFVAMGIDVPIHIVHRAKEIGSGFKAAKDLAASINLALLTAAVGFGVLIFARAGVLKSLGWIALLGTVAIWWIGLIILPAVLEKFWGGKKLEEPT